MGESGESELRKFCVALVRQYDRLVKTGQTNFGTALCVVQPWEVDRLRVALEEGKGDRDGRSEVG